MRQQVVPSTFFTAPQPADLVRGLFPSPLTLLPMASLSSGSIEALEASLRSLRGLGELQGPRSAGAVRRISGAILVIGPNGSRLVRRSAGRPHRHYARCTCARPARRKTDQPHRTDH